MKLELKEKSRKKGHQQTNCNIYFKKYLGMLKQGQSFVWALQISQNQSVKPGYCSKVAPIFRR